MSQTAEINPEIMDEINQYIVKMEEITGKKFGDKQNPLLVSVRSGAVISMPGMMDTILNLGLNEDVVDLSLYPVRQGERQPAAGEDLGEVGGKERHVDGEQQGEEGGHQRLRQGASCGGPPSRRGWRSSTMVPVTATP